MRSLRSVTLGTAFILWLSACAIDPRPPVYHSIDLSKDLAAQILAAYIDFLPDEWERGIITVESCGNIDVDCDYYVEHETISCDFDSYLILFPAGTGLSVPYFKIIPDKRAIKCIA